MIKNRHFSWTIRKFTEVETVNSVGVSIQNKFSCETNHLKMTSPTGSFHVNESRFCTERTRFETEPQNTWKFQLIAEKII